MIPITPFKFSTDSAIGVEIGLLKIYFSYTTPIAFNGRSGFYISQNEWSNTTGRHLNAIDEDKKKRIPHSELMEKLQKEVEVYLK